MKAKKRLTEALMMSGLIAFFIVAFTPSAVLADRAADADQIVQKARLTVQNFANDSSMGAFRDLAKKAKGMLIAPQILKGAFVLGASGGSGVLVVRKDATGPWSNPAFYTIGEASFGLQIGGQSSQVILLAMTGRGVTAFLGNSFKLGGNIGIAAGPVGAGASAASANLSADILSFSVSQGLYGGISLDGAVIAVRDALNDAYYGKQVAPMDILVKRNVSNPKSDQLIGEVRKIAGP